MIRRKVITPAASSLLVILKQFIKEVRVGRDYNIEIVLNVPLDEFEEFKRHAASAGRGKNQKNKSQNPQKVGRCTSNAGIVVLDKTAGETISIVPKKCCARDFALLRRMMHDFAKNGKKKRRIA